MEANKYAIAWVKAILWTCAMLLGMVAVVTFMNWLYGVTEGVSSIVLLIGVFVWLTRSKAKEYSSD